MQEQVVIRAYTVLPEADLARAMLAAAGITATLRDESTVGIYPLYSGAIGGVKLCVGRSEVDRAREIISTLSEKPESAKTQSEKSESTSARAWWKVALGFYAVWFSVNVAFQLRHIRLWLLVIALTSFVNILALFCRAYGKRTLHAHFWKAYLLISTADFSWAIHNTWVKYSSRPRFFILSIACMILAFIPIFVAILWCAFKKNCEPAAGPDCLNAR